MLLKHSLLDLIVKGALTVYQEKRLPNPNSSRSQPYIFISKGPYFNQYRASNTTMPLVSYFKDGHNELGARLVYRSTLDACDKEGGYKHAYLAPDLKQAGHLSSMWFLEKVGLYQLSKGGKRLCKRIKAQLKQVDQILGQSAIYKPDETKELLEQLGWNILLSKMLRPIHLDQLDSIYNDLS